MVRWRHAGITMGAACLACAGEAPDPTPAPASASAAAADAVVATALAPLRETEAVPLPFTFVMTEGEFPAGKGKYPTLFATDGDPETTWVVQGTGHFEVDDAQILALEILPGYAKSDTTWTQNRRPTKIRWAPLLVDDEPHKRGAVRRGPWTEVAIDPPERATGAGYARVAVSDGTTLLRGVEIEVLEATPKTKYDDICIAEVRFLGRSADPAPRAPGDAWGYMSADWLGSVPDDQRLDAPFDSFNPKKCTFDHDYTGGGGVSFSGRCEATAGGWHLVGTRRSDDSEEAYDEVLSVTPIGDCLALIDGWPFERC